MILLIGIVIIRFQQGRSKRQLYQEQKQQAAYLQLLKLTLLIKYLLLLVKQPRERSVIL
uniref:Uncharacterized protein n=1 Tax=Siphoviridae sp. ctxMM9 TaxID=2827973 RepID=A0A8S5T664_9CAUD|nr:MAG TPA: hypothetical protein [Siphoviridae sp. ctxMM9]